QDGGGKPGSARRQPACVGHGGRGGRSAALVSGIGKILSGFEGQERRGGNPQADSGVGLVGSIESEVDCRLVELFCRPCGAYPFLQYYPRLTPWAAHSGAASRLRRWIPR